MAPIETSAHPATRYSRSNAGSACQSPLPNAHRSKIVAGNHTTNRKNADMCTSYRRRSPGCLTAQSFSCERNVESFAYDARPAPVHGKAVAERRARQLPTPVRRRASFVLTSRPATTCSHPGRRSGPGCHPMLAGSVDPRRERLGPTTVRKLLERLPRSLSAGDATIFSLPVRLAPHSSTA